MSDVQIIGLPTAPSAITGTELVPIVQNGLTVQTTVAAITASPSQSQPFLTVGQQPTLPNSRYFSAGTGLGITDGGAQGAYTIAFNGTAASLEASGTGFAVKTAANTITPRSLAVSGNGLSVSNGTGISGDPTFSLSGLPLALANASGTGMVAINGAALSPVTITGTANQIGVTNGNGVGNPTISIVNNPVISGNAGLTLPIGTSVQRVNTTGAVRLNSDLTAFEGYNGTSWTQFLTSGVTTFSAGTTGFTPTSAASGAVTLAGILNSANGGTGASSLTGYLYGNGASAATASTTIPSTAITGLGTMSTQNANAVAITGGTINGTTVGATSASTGAFTTLSASSTVSGTGFSTYLASPPAIGSTTPSTGAFTTLTDTGLTSSRVTYAGTGGLLRDSANLTFDGTTLTAAGFSGPINGVITSSSITDSGLTSGRVTYAGTGGLLQDSANLTFNGTTLTTANDATVNGNNVGKGGGSVASNQSFGGFNLSKNTTGSNNSAYGYFALYNNLTGGGNIGIGLSALQNNTTGSNQVAIGFQALNNAVTAVGTLGSITAGSGYTNGTYTAVSMTPVSGATFSTYPTVTVVVAGGVVTTVTLVTAGIGASSTAATVLTVAAALIGGTGSGFSIPVATFATAANNTAIGFSALAATTTGSGNTGLGYQALVSNTTGVFNSAVGQNALNANTTGVYNQAFGASALLNNTTGGYNSAVGVSTLQNNTTGSFNSGYGVQALTNNISASNNVAMGYLALQYNTIGPNQIAIGVQALQNATTAVASLGTVTGGTGYTNGTYTGVVMTLSSGSSAITYPTATIVVAGGVVSTVTLTAFGSGFKDTTTVLTAPAASIGGTGSGFTVPVTALSTGQDNVAVGFQSLNAVTSGIRNTAIGYGAGGALINGINTLILGYQAAASSTGANNEITLGNSSITAFRIPGLSITAAPSALTVGSQFAVTNTASAVNYLQVTGAATAGAPILSAQGSDTNIGITLTPKGTGAVTTAASVGIGTTTPNANLELVGSPANLVARGSLTTSGAQVGALAHDYFSGPSYKGTSLVQYSATASGTTCGISNASLGSLTFNNTAANALIYTNGGTGIIFGTLSVDRGRVDSSGVWSFGAVPGSESLRATPVASAVNYVNVIGAITTASPAIQAAGSDTNIDLALTPKGTGVLSFGTYTAGVVAQAGYISIKDAAGNVRRLLVG